LLFGTPPNLPVDEVVTEPNVSLVDQRLISRYFTLMPEHRRVVREVVEGLCALNPENTEPINSEARP
jgi:hypothetical protein